MATVVLAPLPQLQFFDQSGKPLAFGKVYAYVSGTTTPLDTFTDSTGTTLNSNPVILSAGGSANIWLQSGQTYTLKVTTAAGATLYTVDGIGGGVSVQTTVVPFSATPTFNDISQNQLFQFTLTANAAALPLNVVGVTPPGIVIFEISQDALGGHTFSWPANVIGGGKVGSQALQVTTQAFVWDGTNAVAIGPAMTGSGPSISVGNIIAGIITATGLTVNGLTPPYVLFKNTTPIVHTGDTTVDTVYSITIPALQSNSVLRITIGWIPLVQGASGTTISALLAGTAIATLGNFSNAGGYATHGLQTIITLVNNNSTNSQTVDTTNAFPLTNSSTQIVSLYGLGRTIPTNVPTTLTVTAQNGSNSDSQQFSYILVELL